MVQRSHAIYGGGQNPILLLHLNQRPPWPIQRTRKIQRALFATGHTETTRALLRHDRKHRQKYRAPPPLARGQGTDRKHHTDLHGRQRHIHWERE